MLSGIQDVQLVENAPEIVPAREATSQLLVVPTTVFYSYPHNHTGMYDLVGTVSVNTNLIELHHVRYNRITERTVEKIIDHLESTFANIASSRYLLELIKPTISIEVANSDFEKVLQARGYTTKKSIFFESSNQKYMRKVYYDDERESQVSNNYPSATNDINLNIRVFRN